MDFIVRFHDQRPRSGHDRRDRRDFLKQTGEGGRSKLPCRRARVRLRNMAGGEKDPRGSPQESHVTLDELQRLGTAEPRDLEVTKWESMQPITGQH